MLGQNSCHDYIRRDALVMVTLHKVHTKIGPSQILKIFSELLDIIAGHVLNFFGTLSTSKNGDIAIFKKWGELS